jgi:lysophospholipase L1-like esterase
VAPRPLVACIGDSITAGSPLWEPNPVLRVELGEAADEHSQWEWWAERFAPGLAFRNHGVNGERTEQIAARLPDALDGADGLVVQGGINDVVHRRSIDDAARNLAGMVEEGLRRGLVVALADVLPWNNGYEGAAALILRLNELVHAVAADLGVPLLPFHDTLVDPERPERMPAELTDDGNHPSVEGHRLLGQRVGPLLEAAFAATA